MNDGYTEGDKHQQAPLDMYSGKHSMSLIQFNITAPMVSVVSCVHLSRAATTSSV